MDIITTHIRADFDNLAAMLSASKLYPQALLVFSGSQKKNVRDYLAQEFHRISAFRQISQINLSKVRRLIVVGTRKPAQIGPFQACLQNPGLALHLFDHHAEEADGLQGNPEYVRPFGATTTVLTQLFQEQGLRPTPEESTLMVLGIYENTNIFLSSATRPEDLAAASWLLAQGANLDIVKQFVSREFSERQNIFLAQLQHQAITMMINGARVVLSTLMPEDQVNDFAAIVQRMMTVENADVLVGLLNMDERVFLVVRSRIPELNAGVVARAFGGGGHTEAGSATIYDQSPNQIEERLITLLHNHIRPKALARDLMSAPVIATTPEVNIHQANQLMTRYNVTVLPVVRSVNSDAPNTPPSGLLGMISRTVVEKTIFHKLGNLPVIEYMTTDIATIPEDGSLADIQRLIIGRRQRIIPVMRGDSIMGVITRTDLLNLLVTDPANLAPDQVHEDELPAVKRSNNLLRRMIALLPRETIVLLRGIGETAANLGYHAYVAGGFVRDLLLQVKNTDVDIVVEGDGIRFAGVLAKQRQGTVYPHEKFGTATVIFPDDSRVDVATSRLEYYDAPAAMPTVEKSSIKLDLHRRDFTINAMAIHLNPDSFGNLVDYFNCQNDLKERRVQVLHNLSFVEDPTRIFRAIRFEGRLDFRITPHTEKLIKNTVQMNLFGQIQEPRFFHELKLILSENNPIPALLRMASFNLFPFLWPDLRPPMKATRRFLEKLSRVREHLAWFQRNCPDDKLESWMVYLLVLMSQADVAALQDFCARFDIAPKQCARMLLQKEEAERIARKMLARPQRRPSEIYRLLEKMENEGLLYLTAIARKRAIQEAVVLYCNSLRHTLPLVDGKELKAMGYTPGPLFKTLFNHLIERQLDEGLCSVEEARALLLVDFPPEQQARHR